MEGGSVPLIKPPSPAPSPRRYAGLRRGLGLGAIWLLALLAAGVGFLLLEAAAPAIGLPARIALAALPLAAGAWSAAVVFPAIRKDALPEPRGLASLPPTGGPTGAGEAARASRPPVPRPERAGGGVLQATPPALPTSPAALVTHLLRDAAARPATEAERRELAVRGQHDRGFAVAMQGLDETACRALLAARRHPVLAADLADTARRIRAARLVQAPLPPDPRRDALHAAMLAAAPAAAAEFLEVMRIAPDLDAAEVATNLLRGIAPEATTNEHQLTKALETLSRLGPVSARTNRDGSITLRPSPEAPLPPAVPAPPEAPRLPGA